MIRTFKIGARRIGPGCPCFIIAEAGVNHNGNVAMALRLVDMAAEAGADAVKFQTFHADKVVSVLAPLAEYQELNMEDRGSQLEMLRRLELSEEEHDRIRQHCVARGIMFLSTPFDEDSTDYLERAGVPAFKVGSGDLTNLPLLMHIGRKGRPMIVSTGMADMDEVRAAVDCLRGVGNPAIILLHCVSNYPADPADANLRAMLAMARAFAVPVGFSDHTQGSEVALAAVALGACVIEKHFTLDRNLPGPDHRASMEPTEFAALVQGILKIESALGDGVKRAAASERSMAKVARRSLVAEQDIPAGTTVTLSMIGIKRPGTGLSPQMRGRVVGRRARVDIPAGTLLSWDMFA